MWPKVFPPYPVLPCPSWFLFCAFTQWPSLKARGVCAVFFPVQLALVRLFIPLAPLDCLVLPKPLLFFLHFRNPLSFVHPVALFWLLPPSPPISLVWPSPAPSAGSGSIASLDLSLYLPLVSVPPCTWFHEKGSLPSLDESPPSASAVRGVSKIFTVVWLSAHFHRLG